MASQIDLSDFFISKSQANDFKTRLDNVIDKVYSTNFNLENCLLEEFGMEKKDKFISLLRNNKINITSNSNVQEFLKTLQESLLNLQVITLTIAFEPTQETLKILSQWFIFNMNKQVILDFQINKKIVAGAIINFDGKFKDYSIKPTLDRIIKETLSHVDTRPIQEKTSHQNTEPITAGK